MTRYVTVVITTGESHRRLPGSSCRIVNGAPIFTRPATSGDVRSHRRAVLAMFVLTLGLWQRLACAQTPPPYRDVRLPTADRVRDLLGRMTREEKFWQLFMIPGDLGDASHDYSHGVFGLQISPADSTGANAARRHAERINTIQRYFVD